GADRAAARCLGAHLEGPFLSLARRGTHPAAHLREPDMAFLEPVLAAGPVVGITIAPELPGAVEIIRELARRGVLVALGHSDAAAADAHAGFDAGARTVTHVFNGMSSPTARAPGLAGVALARDDVAVQVICDGEHLAPETVALVVSATRSRFVLVTDALPAADAPDGRYTLGEIELVKADGRARNADGALAGSVASLPEAVRRAVLAGASVEDALAAVTTRPADLLAPADLPRLRPGDRADVTVLDDALDVTATFVAGVPAE
ncbi:MAG: amidohydrolase family protein, partial [Actinomycetota bacterium]|nr:amidohydrolase family protein [Actinomycetota bacterium]